MTPGRRLALRREALTALTSDELAVVAGAAIPTPPTVPIDDCVRTTHCSIGCP